MIYYPQLLTGSVCQYPVTRRNRRRTIVNAFGDGANIRMADDGAAEVKWDLIYSHITTDESMALQRLFEASCGSWQTFTFLDPADNLLNWNEDISQPVWEKDALLQATAGVNDPLGGVNGSRLINGSQTTQQIWQSLPIAGWFQYCLSLYVRADQPTPFELFGATSSGEIHGDYTAVASWTHFSLPVHMSSQVNGLRVGLTLEQGQSVYVFGIQLEPQIGAGGYKKTRDRAGVYPNTRFDQDIFRVVATGVNQYSCAVKLLSNVAG